MTKSDENVVSIIDTDALRQAIADADDISTELVFIPEWNVTLKVISLSTIARSQLAAKFTDDSGKVDMEKLYPQLVIATTLNPANDEPVFTYKDAAMINSKSAKAVEKLADAARRLSGFGEDESANLEREAGKD